MPTVQDSVAPPRNPLVRVVAASMIGTTVEWYDFFLYGTAAALVFNKLFFPKSDPLVGAMLALGTYALGFVARPIGGVVFGHFGDRIGRKALLMLSLMMMGGATVAVGLLPTYASIGVWAPILLVVLRLIQGFAVGGEWGGAVLLVAEHGDAKRRGFWTSWPQAGVPLGNLIAAGVLAVMATMQSEKDFLAWGWRVPFLLSAVLVAIGYWVRVSVSESPLFESVKEKAAEGVKAGLPAVQALLRHPRGIAIGAGLRLGENMTYYVITVFSITYMTTVVGLSRGVALNAVLIGAAAECLTIPLFGILSDKIGRRPVYGIAAVGMAIWAFAFFQMLHTGATWPVIGALVGGLVLHGAMYGPQAAFISELFPTPVRYSGVSIAYQVTSIFAGSLAPIIALALLSRYHSAVPIAIYMLIMCVGSAIAAFAARETKGKPFAQIDAELA